jgi:hypothetical protein
LRNRLIRLAAFQNPEFYKTQAMRLSTYDKPRVIACAVDHAKNTCLPIKDLTQGNYVNLVDPEDYYTYRGKRVPRQRIRDNLLGDRRFCPTIRRTPRLSQFEASNLSERCRQIMKEYPLELLKRALSHLHTKESKSSFEIEHIKPTATRTERFVSLLQMAEKDDFFHKPALIDLQNHIVDERLRDHDYRVNQNYVGESVSWQSERVHFVSPKAGDLIDRFQRFPRIRFQPNVASRSTAPIQVCLKRAACRRGRSGSMFPAARPR